MVTYEEFSLVNDITFLVLKIFLKCIFVKKNGVNRIYLKIQENEGHF